MSIFAQVIGGPASPSYHGAALTADLNIGDTVLHVDDTADFDEEAAAHGGAVMMALNLGADGMIDPTSGTVLPYLTCTSADDAGTVLTAPQTAAYPPAILADTPLGYWRLGEAVGTVAADASPNHRDGAYNAGSVGPGTYNLAQPPAITDTDTAVKFDGGYIQVPYGSWMDVTTTVSYEAWVKPLGTGANGGIIGRWGSGINAGLLWINAASQFEAIFTYTGSNFRAIWTTVPTAGVWYHLVGTTDGVNVRLYVNGVAVATVPVTPGAGTIATGSFPLTIGCFAAGASVAHAYLDEVAAYSTALSATQVAAHYAAATATVSGPPPTVTTPNTVTLAVPSTVAMSAGDWVYIQNPVTGLAVGDTEVMVMLDDADETGDALMVSIDTSMLGGYAYPDLTNHAVELEEDEDGQLVVRNLPGLAQALPWITPDEGVPPVTVVDTSTGVVLASGVSDPVIAPTVKLGYQSVPLQQVARTGTLGTFALDPTQVTAMCNNATAGVVSVAQVVTGGTRIWYYDYTSGQNVQVGGAYFLDTSIGVVGMALAGTTFRLLGRLVGGGGLYVYDPASGLVNAYTPVNTGQDPTLGSDGSVFIVAENDPGAATTLRVRDIGFDSSGGTPPVPVTVTTVLGANTGTGTRALDYIGRGSFDYGSAKYVFAGVSTASFVTAASAGATRDPTLQWPMGPAGRLAQCWVPGAAAFFMLSGDGNLYRYTGATVADGLTQWWTGLTWKDTAGTPHETRLGPTAAVTMVNRAQLQVTIPAPPTGTGTADDINAYGLYMTKVASGTPASSAFHLQVSAAPDPGATSTQILTTVNMGGAAPPAINGFPTVGVAGYLASQAADTSGPLIMLKGDGSGRIGQATWDTTGAWTGGPSYAGQVITAAPSAVNTPVSVTVTFPAGRFTSTPSIVCSPGGGAPQTVQTSWSAASSTGVTIWGSRSSGTLSAITINYIATQMG